jgi:hypothetical protein
MDEFEILENQAKELFKAFPDLEFKTIAAFTLIVGWLLTAEHAQVFICNHPLISILGSIIAFGSFAIAQIFFLMGHHKKLSNVHLRMKSLAHEKGYSSEVVNTYDVSFYLPASYAVINVLFCTAIITLIGVIGYA